MSNTYKNSYIAPEKDLVSLSVYNTGYEKCSANHQWGPGIRNHFLLHYVIAGKGYYKTPTTTYTLTAGDVFLIYPFQEVTYYADADDPWEYAWVGFAGADAKTIMKSTSFSNSSPVMYQIPNSEYIRRQLVHIYEARGIGIYSAVEMTGRLYTTLSGFLVKEKLPNNSHQSFYDLYAKQGCEYIHTHYSYPITVTDIAEYVGVSRSHLFRAFQESMRCSPKEYLTKYRIDQACILLQHSTLSITAVGRSVGFEDNLNFSKAFKKATGIAPSKYNK